MATSELDMEYGVISTDDVPLTDLSEIDDVPPNLEVRPVSRELDTQKLTATLWYFAEGDEIRYHAHAEQEELYYVIEGQFSLKLGRSGETEIREVGPGDFWVAAQMIGHGHRCISAGGGTVLAVGAPASHDPGLDPHQLEEGEVDAGIE